MAFFSIVVGLHISTFRVRATCTPESTLIMPNKEFSLSLCCSIIRGPFVSAASVYVTLSRGQRRKSMTFTLRGSSGWHGDTDNGVGSALIERDQTATDCDQTVRSPKAVWPLHPTPRSGLLSPSSDPPLGVGRVEGCQDRFCRFSSLRSSTPLPHPTIQLSVQVAIDRVSTRR